MSQRAARPTNPPDAAEGAEEPSSPRIGSAMTSSGLAQRIAAPHSLAEAEKEYVVCRDAWTAAMRAANSGRAADLATLAICQEAYEAAAQERDRWLSGARVAIPIVTEPEQSSLDAVVDQALAWQDVHQREKPRGFLGRMFGRRSKD